MCRISQYADVWINALRIEYWCESWVMRSSCSVMVLWKQNQCAKLLVPPLFGYPIDSMYLPVSSFIAGRIEEFSRVSATGGRGALNEFWPVSRPEAMSLSISINPSPEPTVFVTIWSNAQSAGKVYP